VRVLGGHADVALVRLGLGNDLVDVLLVRVAEQNRHIHLLQVARTALHLAVDVADGKVLLLAVGVLGLGLDDPLVVVDLGKHDRALRALGAVVFVTRRRRCAMGLGSRGMSDLSWDRRRRAVRGGHERCGARSKVAGHDETCFAWTHTAFFGLLRKNECIYIICRRVSYVNVQVCVLVDSPRTRCSLSCSIVD
jgi:hypothetical protein